jgi:hypothetical protein
VRVQHAAKGISISKSMYAILADAIRAAGQCMCYLSTLCASCCYRECLGMVCLGNVWAGPPRAFPDGVPRHGVLAEPPCAYSD